MAASRAGQSTQQLGSIHICTSNYKTQGAGRRSANIIL